MNFFQTLKINISITFVLTGMICASQNQHFTNPILEDGPDPYVYLHSDGYYYVMVTRGNRLHLWKTADFTNLGSAQSADIWFPADTGSNSCCIWAPEIHFINNTWYIYYTAADKKNPVDESRYVYVLKNNSSDPLSGSWTDLGKINTVYPGIDGHVFEWSGSFYFIYSPYVGNQSGIMIARMKSPFEIEQPVFLLALPKYDWEKTDEREIMEGPQFLEGPRDKLFVIYSAGACWDDNYGLGMLYANKNSDLLNPSSWTRNEQQVFSQCPDSSVFGPGHNCFVKSVDGKENWIVYHAKKTSSTECKGRSMRAQKFEWNEMGFPDFGRPVSINTRNKIPSSTYNQ